MVNLPIKKDYTPVTSSAASIIAVMDDMRSQQQNLSTMIGQMTSLSTNFSDDLVSASNTVNNIISHTDDISSRLLKQQQALSTIQSVSPSSANDLVNTLGGEIGQLKTVTSQLSAQATSLTNIISSGTNFGLPVSDITKNLNSEISGFTNKAQSLVTGLTSHIDSLNSVIASSQKSLSGIITNSPLGSASSTVQNMLKGSDVSTLTSGLSSLTDDENLDMIKREVSQKFNDISDQVKGTLDNLKSSVTGAISAKIGDVNQLQAAAGDLTGALNKATAGLTNLNGPISQLSGLSGQLDTITSGLTTSLGSISSDFTTGFKDQLGQINDITTSLQSIGSTVTSQIGDLTSTVQSSINGVGGFNSLTGAVGGVDSLTSITNPASQLSSSITEMSTLGRNLMTSAGSLNLMADGLPANNPISQLSNQLINIGDKLYNHSVDTPATLDTLASAVETPHLNLGSLEKSIANTASDLTAKTIPNVSLNVNMDSIVNDLTTQVLALNNKTNSSQGS